jgi:hypothetical protein
MPSVVLGALSVPEREGLQGVGPVRMPRRGFSLVVGSRTGAVPTWVRLQASTKNPNLNAFMSCGRDGVERGPWETTPASSRGVCGRLSQDAKRRTHELE